MRFRAPKILGLDPGLPFSLYWWRLRRRAAAQEMLAAAGIAIGVGLVFGVLIAIMTLAAGHRWEYRRGPGRLASCLSMSMVSRHLIDYCG